MESLYLLIPLSVGLVLGLLGLFAWALNADQFDDLDRHGEEILLIDSLDPDQAG
ncbi:MAG: cbb3-type cytochrome oxidase assembly protein CcoS [Burkholderiaceae bacterium]